MSKIDELKNLLGDAQAANLTSQKTTSVIEAGYNVTGFILMHPDHGSRCYVEMSAVRWLSNKQCWNFMHEDFAVLDEPQPACAAGEYDEYEPVCKICDEEFELDPDGENDRLCHNCAHHEVARLERDNAALRAIFPQILEALESGGCTADASVEFLQHIPDEVRMVIGKHKRELEALRGDLKLCHDKAAAIQRVISGSYGSERAKKLAASIEALAGKAVAE